MPYCVYCGARATDRDHLRAVSRTERGRGSCRPAPLKGTVPACRVCNNRLSAYGKETVSERAAYLLNYELHLRDPDVDRITALVETSGEDPRPIPIEVLYDYVIKPTG